MKTTEVEVYKICKINEAGEWVSLMAHHIPSCYVVRYELNKESTPLLKHSGLFAFKSARIPAKFYDEVILKCVAEIMLDQAWTIILPLRYKLLKHEEKLQVFWKNYPNFSKYDPAFAYAPVRTVLCKSITPIEVSFI